MEVGGMVWFRDFDEIFREMEEEFEDMFNRMMRGFQTSPSENAKTFGYTIYWDSSLDKPVVRYFGNVNPKTGELLEEGWRIPYAETSYDKEKNKYVVIAELPGVEKKDIKVKAAKNHINIVAENKNRKYKKRIDFDKEINPQSIKAHFKNGILELEVEPVTPPEEEETEITVE